MPSHEEDPVLNANLTSYKNLRKLLAAGNSVEGNLYFVGDTRAEKAAVVITLSKRDKDGKRALGKGRPLRKTISGSKFARARIRIRNNRIWIEVGPGNATQALLQKAFKKGFAEPDLARMKLLLKNVRFGNPETDTSPEDAASDQEAIEAAAQAIAEMDEADRDDVSALLNEHGDLQDINQQLEDAFLSEDDAEQEEAEEREKVLQELNALARTDPGNPRIQELRYGLVEMLQDAPSSLEDEFPAVGEPLSAGMVAILRVQLDSSVNQLLAQLRQLAAEIAAAHSTASALTGRQQATSSEQALKTLQQHPEKMQALLDQIHTMTR